MASGIWRLACHGKADKKTCRVDISSTYPNPAAACLVRVYPLHEYIIDGWSPPLSLRLHNTVMG